MTRVPIRIKWVGEYKTSVLGYLVTRTLTGSKGGGVNIKSVFWGM